MNVDNSILEQRHRVVRAIRRFFWDRDYIEVETPVRIPSPCLELHIDAEPAGNQFLRTSPELHMKRLLAGGSAKIFQIGPCFRRGEKGNLHRPEFTMLEWYRTGVGYMEALAETKALVAHVAKEVPGQTGIPWQGGRIELMPVWDSMTVRDAFIGAAGWDPVSKFDADRFSLDLVEKVEPSFSPERPTVLYDYPAEAAALSRLKPGDPSVAERWELYIGGMEIANAFSELTDAVEQRRRFEQCAEQRKARGGEVYPVDEEFLEAMERGIPECAGVALGVDRLVMLLTNLQSIGDVRIE